MSVSGKSVLLVDDDPDLHKIVDKILANVGMSVYHARTVKEALSMMGTKHPHLIITDLNMQPETGFDLLQKLRTTEGAIGVPVIVLSSRTGYEAVHQAMSLGAREYLRKPVEANQILQKVRKLLRSSEFKSVEFNPGAMPMVTMKIPGTIVAGHEQCLKVEASVRLSREMAVVLDSAELAPMGFERPPTMRSSENLAKANERGAFGNELRFLGLVEKQVSKLKEIIARWHTK